MGVWSRLVAVVGVVVVCVGFLQAPDRVDAAEIPSLEQVEWNPSADWDIPELPRPDGIPDPWAAVDALDPLAESEPWEESGLAGEMLAGVQKGLEDVAERAKEAVDPSISTVEVNQPAPVVGDAITQPQDVVDGGAPEDDADAGAPPGTTATPTPETPSPEPTGTTPPAQEPPGPESPLSSVSGLGGARGSGIAAATRALVVRPADWVSPTWCTSPNGQWGFSIDSVTTISPVTNTLQGTYDFVIRNRGSMTIPSGTVFRYTVFDAGGHAYLPSHAAATLTTAITAGGTSTVRMTVDTLTPGQTWTTTWDANIPGVGLVTDAGACAPTVSFSVVNQAPALTLLSPAIGATIQGTTPYLSASGVDPDRWPNATLTYSFKICTDAALTANCVNSGAVSSFTWQVPSPGLSWGGHYYWKATISDGQITVDSTAAYPPSDFFVVAPVADDWRRVGAGLGMASVGGLILPYGIFVSTASDASVSGAEQGLTIDRVYSSGADSTEGAFGLGWLSIFDARLVMPSTTSGIATVTYPDGRQESFGRNPNGTWAAGGGLGVTNKFSVDASGAAKVDETTGTTDHFDRYGELTRVVYGDSEWQITRTGSEITRITQLPSGRSLTVTWGSNPGTCADAPQSTRRHVSSIGVTGDPDRVWTYQYRCSRLVSVTDPEDGVTRYTTTANSFAGTSPDGTPLPGVSSYGSWTNASTDHQQRQVVLTVPGSVNRKISLLRSRGTTNYVNTVNFYGGQVAKYCEYRTIVSGTEACPQNLTTLYFDPQYRVVMKQRSAAGVAASPENSRYWLYSQITGELQAFADENGHGVSYTYDASGNPSGSYVFRDANTQVTSSTNFRAPTATDPDFRIAGSGISPTQSYATKYDMYTYDPTGHLTQRVGPATPAAPAGEVTTYQYTSTASSAYGSDGELLEGVTTPAGLLASATNRGGADVYRYAGNGDLASFAEVGSGYTGRTYDAAGQVTSETTGGTGEDVTTRFTRDDLGRVVGEEHECITNPITDQRSRQEIIREFDGDGLVARIVEQAIDCTTQQPISADRITTFEYDTAGRLTKTLGPTGGATVYTYDPANPTQVKTMTDARGRVFTYTYSALTGQLATVYADVDRSGVRMNLLIASYQYDLAGRLMSESDASGRVTEYTYTDDDLVKRIVRKNVGNTNNYTKRDVEMWRGTYDGRGKITSETVGGSRTTTYFYDSEGRLQSQTLDPAGVNRTTTYTRDPQGRVTAVSVTDGTHTESVRYTVDAAGNPLTATVENGATDLTTTFTRDQNELITSTISPRSTASSTPNNGATSIGYDSLGRVSTVTGPLISTAQPTSLTAFTGITRTNERAVETFGYDAFGNITHVEDASGNVTAMAYDAAGHLIETASAAYTAPGAPSPVTAHTTRTYSPAGDMLTETDPRDSTTSFTYDIAGNNTRIERTVPTGGHRTTIMGYTPANDLSAIVDARGAGHGLYYDELGRVNLSTVYPLEEGGGDGGITVTNYRDYDDAGNLTDTWLDGLYAKNGYHTRYQYNGAGELTARWNPGVENPTRYTRDVAGRVLTETRPDGVIAEHVYDPAGRETSTTRVGTDGSRLTTSYTYDRDGNLLTTQHPNGQTQTWTYDLAGNLKTLTEQVTATSTRVVQLDYDVANRVVRTLDARNSATWNTYNVWGLLEKRIEPSTTAQSALADRSWAYAYDVDGQVRAEMAPGGASRTFIYDQTGQLTSLDATDPAHPDAAVSHQYGHSNAGDLTSVDAPGGVAHYTWGSVGQLLTVRGPTTNADFTYRDNLLPSARFDHNFLSPEGFPHSTTYTFDNSGRPTGVIDYQNRHNDSVRRTFDFTTGRPAADTFTVAPPSTSPQTVSTVTYGYDAMGRRSTDTTKNSSGSVVTETAYTHDAVDNITARTVTGSPLTGGDAYQYDLASRLTAWTPTAPAGGSVRPTTAYTWDANDNRTSSSDGSTTQTWTYDQRNRTTSTASTAAGNTTTTPVASDPRGNITSIGSRPLTYDAVDELLSDGTTTYQYDGLGRPTLRNGTDELHYDPYDTDPVATVPATGTTETSTSPFPDAPTITRNMGTGAVGAILTNTHTDSTRLINSAGTTTTAVAYTPFGQRLAGSSASGTGTYRGFQGDWTDPTTGTVRMGARWYDPTLGTFLTRDTLTLPLNTAGSMNRYTYGNGNPVSTVDPTGHSPSPVIAPPGVDFWEVVGPLRDWGARTLAQVSTVSSTAEAAAARTAVAGLARAATPALGRFALGAAVGAVAGPEMLILGGVFLIAEVVTGIARMNTPAASGLDYWQIEPTIPAAPAPRTLTEWRIGVTTEAGAYGTARTVTVTNGLRTTTQTTWGRQTTELLQKYSDGSWYKNTQVIRVATGSESFTEPLINPLRPGIQVPGTNGIGTPRAVRSPSQATNTATQSCGLGGTIASCQTPSLGIGACSGLEATASLCLPATPIAGRPGGTQANLPQQQATGTAAEPSSGAEMTPETATGSSGGGKSGPPRFPLGADDYDCDDLAPKEQVDSLRNKFENGLRQEYWRNEAATNSRAWSTNNLALMATGRAPYGIDGNPMEVHHILPLYMGGGNGFDNLTHLTRTEHRLGDNFKNNHPC